MALLSGTRLGHFEILSPLGAGGMGEVYRAKDTHLKREVALKVLPEGFASDAGRMARFQREAELLAALNHPNIAAIYGFQQGALIMELVEGGTLSMPLPIDTALRYARQIAEALEYAHEHGVIHRDLKPDNVKVTSEGVVKLLDFGLAKAIEAPGAPGGDPANTPTLVQGVTRVGAILGTAAYMSPEQARGQAVDRRTDIWAFGAVLYELLTGRHAFQGESVSDVLAAVLDREPDWSALPPATPARVRELLRVCLAKDRKARLQAVGDARLFLDAALVEEPVANAQVPRRQVLPWALAGVLAPVSIASLWALWRAPRRAGEGPFLQMDLDTGSNAVSQPAISPDGMRIVFVSKDSLAIRRLDEGKIAPLAGTEGAFGPFFSPDGRWVAFFAHRKLYKIAVDGGAPVALCDVLYAIGGTWVDDDHIVAALEMDGVGGLFRISASGGTPQRNYS